MTPMQQDQQNQPQRPVAVAAPAPSSGMAPRLSGALMVGGGVLLEGINVGILINSNTYYPKLLMIGAVLITYGGWTLVTGIAYDKNNPVKPPVWWTVGAVLAVGVGIAAGIGVIAAIS